VEINCCHAASDGLMVRVLSDVENTSRTVKHSSDSVNRVHGPRRANYPGQPAFLRHPLPGNREGTSRWTAVSFVDAALASYSGRASAATIAGISVPCSQLLG